MNVEDSTILRVWFVQYLRPDGWWDLCYDDGEPLTYKTKRGAENAVKRQLEHYPQSSYRASEDRGIRWGADGQEDYPDA